MRAAEVEIGGRYVIREYSKSVRGCVVWNSGKIIRRTPSFPAYWTRREVTIVEKQRRRWLVEWTEPHPLHRIPDRKMVWTTRIARTTVTASQVMERADG